MLVRFIIAVGICMQVIFPFLQPVLFAYVVYQSFNPNFCSAFPHVLRGFQEAALRPYVPWLGTCATFGYMAWYCYWVAHYSKSAASFDERLFWITVVLTHTLGLYSYYMVLTVTIHVAFDLVPVWQRPIVAFLIGTHYTCPMVTAMLKRDWRTFQTSTVGILPYVAFFPMWSFIYGYNIARLWDVTWGNRYGVLNEKDEVQQKVTEYRAQSNRLTRYYLAGAVVVTGVICFSTSRYDASYLHVVYVVPWYMISAIMGLVSVLWTMQYQMHRETKGAPPIFRQSTYRRLNHYFTFGKEKSIYMV
jgi:hypothetical protein